MPEETPQETEKRILEARQAWDAAASGFDAEPDHGLNSPAVRTAWTDLLGRAFPSEVETILDIGCGTGSLCGILAEAGHQVTGIDVSPAMLALARAKAAARGFAIEFFMQDGAFPVFQPGQFDGVLCRHLLWALPEPDQVLRRWTGLIRPGGHLFLVEGLWHTGAGLHAAGLVRALPPDLTGVTVQNLSSQPDLWGGPVSDERYAIYALKRSA